MCHLVPRGVHATHRCAHRLWHQGVFLLELQPHSNFPIKTAWLLCLDPFPAGSNTAAPSPSHSTFLGGSGVHKNPPPTIRARRAPPNAFTAAGGRKAHLHGRDFGHPSMSKAGVATQKGTYPLHLLGTLLNAQRKEETWPCSIKIFLFKYKNKQ